ncbi:MAG: hypothetical protein U0637_05885 [Phycisphaerales bacterium]
MKFKPMLEWLKANLWIVIFSVLVVVLLPASFFVSRVWNKKILADQQLEASKEYKLIQDASVKYNLPQFDAKVAAVTTPAMAPNSAVTAFFKRAKETAAAQVGAVAQKAIDFNKGVGPEAAAVGRGEFVPLVGGLFPKVEMSAEEAKDPNVARDKEQAKLNEMEDKLLGKRGNKNPYLELLARVNAGAPESNDALFATLKEERRREEEKITQNKRKLDDAESKELAERIVGARLGQYRSRAQSISFYMTKEAFPMPVADETKTRGTAVDTGDLIEPFANIAWDSIDRKDLTRPKLFMHQWNLWVLSDLLSAVRLANTGPDGRALHVEDGVVKRVQGIVLRNPEGMKTLDPRPVNPDETATAATPPAAPAETTPGIAALDRSVSITGRARGGWNKYYEVRRAEMTCVVSSARLQDFLRAIAQTNYMTVTDLDVDTPVDVWADLAEGYYYGTEHVLRVRVSVESVWLKDWLQPLMPTEIMGALGMEVPAEAAPAATAPGGGG